MLIRSLVCLTGVLALALVVSPALAVDRGVTVLDDGEVIVFTDPATSLKLVDQMLRLGWQESGLEALQ